MHVDYQWLRRIHKIQTQIQVTGFKENEYLQRLRIQKACELLESTKKTFEVIAFDVGYEDVSACRKSFVKIIGLTPKEFRRRFV